METTTCDKYAEFVASISKPGEAIAATITPHQLHCLHMILGVAGEVGELVDVLKKHVMYGKPLDREHVIEELGDIEFYLQGLRNGLRMNRWDIVERNVAKLSKRYAAGSYSDQQAISRQDKCQEAPDIKFD